MLIAEAHRILKAGHTKARVQKIDQRQHHRAQRDGDADAQEVFQYRAGALGNIGLGYRVEAVVAHLVHDHVYERDKRAYGHTQYCASDGDGLVIADLNEISGEGKTHRDLGKHLEHLADGGGLHILIALGQASVGRRKAAQEHCGRQHPDAQRRIGAVDERIGQPLGENKHHR